MPFQNYSFKLSHFIESINPRIATDSHYERPENCWCKKDINNFISTQSRGDAASPFVVADVRSLLDYAEKVGNDEDENYYSKLDNKKYRYVSIDGKHRRKVLSDFINNKISFTGAFYDDRGNRIDVKNKF